MTSLRHTPEGEKPEADRRDSYLDAARECLFETGWRRSTLTEVARRAGVSRMTIYRAWPDMNALLGDLMTREWLTIARGVTPPATHSPEEIADLAVQLVRGLRTNDLFVRIVELDPELLLPYLLTRRGRSQQMVIETLVGAIESGQASGLVRDGNPPAIARGLVLLAHGFVLSATTMVDDQVGFKALDHELAMAVRRSLEP